MKLTNFLIILILFLVPALAPAQTSDEIFQRGLEHFRAGNYESALDDFVLASLLDQSNKTAIKYTEETRKRLLEQKSSQLEEKQTTSAEPQPRNLLEYRKDKKVSYSIDRMLRKASEYYSDGEIPDAIKQWRELLKIDPGNAEGARSISVAEAKVKILELERQLAVESDRAQTVVSDAVDKQLNRASDYYRTGSINQAIKTWQEVLRLMPSNQEAKKSIHIARTAKKYLEKDRRETLVEERRRLKRLSEQEGVKGRDRLVASKMTEARRLYTIGDVPSAISVWRDVLALQPSNSEGAAYLETALQIEPILKSTLKSFKKKDWLKANDGFLKILDIDPESRFAQTYLKQIENEFKKIIDEQSGTRGAYYAEGFFHYNQQQYKEAINAWQKAIALTIGSRKFSLSESEIQDYMARAQSAIAREQKPTRSVVKPKPKTAPAAKPAAKPEPESVKREPTKEDIVKSDEYYNQGLIYFAEGKIRDAILAWELALKYNPDNHKATRNIVKAKGILQK